MWIMITNPFQLKRLLEFFLPVRAQDPFVVGFFVEPVTLALPEKIVQKIHKVRVALVDGPGQGFVGERLIQEHGFAFAWLE